MRGFDRPSPSPLRDFPLPLWRKPGSVSEPRRQPEVAAGEGGVVFEQAGRATGFDVEDVVERQRQGEVGAILSGRQSIPALTSAKPGVSVSSGAVRRCAKSRSTSSRPLALLAALTALAALGCASGQGFYFAKPLETNAALEYFKSRRSLPSR